MNKINNKSISFTLGILAIFALVVLVIPAKVNAAQYYGRGSNGTGTGASGGYITSYNQNTSSAPTSNPTPEINSISPSSSNVGVGTKTINIVGDGFVPSSIARVNGSNRPTTFVDSSHLLMQITGNDTYAYQSNGGFFITVFNPAPGGGYSNAASFKINSAGGAPATASTNNTSPNAVNDTSSNFYDTDENQSSLASNALFGANGISPSSLIQWIFYAILVLLIVILVRKIYGGGERYHATPLKHD